MQNTININKAFYICQFLPALLLFSSLQAQNKNNYLQLTGTPGNFSFATTASLENAQTENGVISVTLSSKAGKCSLYAQVSGSSTTSPTPMPASLLALQLSSISPSLPANFSAIPLSQTNQLLFQSTASFNQEALTYNLIFGPIGYSYAPGTYSFTLLFTMTQP